MAKIITVSKKCTCEVCGGEILSGETASVRYDYDWDNPDEDLQGSVQVPFYRHEDKQKCEQNLRVLRLAAEIDAKFEEDRFHKADF